MADPFCLSAAVAMTGLTGLAAGRRYGLSLKLYLPLTLAAMALLYITGDRGLLFVKQAAFCALMILIALYDREHSEIPWLPLFLLVLLGAFAAPIPFREMLLGWSLIVLPMFLFSLFSDGLGMGDVYLMIPCVMILGMPEVLYGLILGLAASALYYLLWLRRKQTKAAYPQGSWLALGAFFMCQF